MAQKSKSKINFLQISSSSGSESAVDIENINFGNLTTNLSAHPISDNDVRDNDFESVQDDTYVKLRRHDEINLNESELGGYLTDRVIEACSSNLTRSVQPGKLCLDTCSLSKKNLNNIEMLKFHPYLKTLNLSRNQLTSVEPLGFLPFLEYLNVSHNMLTTLLDFKPPLNLTYVIYSFNLIEEMNDLCNFWSLVYLDLSHNLISKIRGLYSLKYLNYLDMSYNRIEKLSNLNNLNLNTLILDYNNIKTVEKTSTVGLWTNYHLTHISISHNYLNSLSLFKGVWNVNEIVASDNEIIDLCELCNMSELKYLYSLDLRKNPICENSKYKNVCLMQMASLQKLDGEVLFSPEKAQVNYLYSTSRKKEAMYNNAALNILSNLAIPEISSAVVPCYQQVMSLIVLVGPMASKKNDYIKKIASAHKKFIKTAISYTTRPRCSHEENSKNYYFVSEHEFKKLLLDGKILCCSQKYGYHFGLGYDELRKVSEQIGILILHCDLTSALQIRAKYLNCKILLCLPRSETTHRLWLQKKFSFSRWISNYVNALVLNYNLQIQRISSMNVKPEKRKSGDSFEAEEEDRMSLLSDEIDTVKQTHQEANEKWSHEYTSETSEARSILKKPNKPAHIVSFSTLAPNDEDLSLEMLTKSIKPPSVTVKRRSTKTEQDFRKEKKKGAQQVILGNETFCEDFLPSTISTMSEQPDSMMLSLMSFDRTKSDDDKRPRRNSTENQIRCISQYLEHTLESEDSDDRLFMLCQVSNMQWGAEATEVAMNYFIQEQMNRRKEYISMYDQNPGLFFTMVFVDDNKEALQKIDDAVRRSVQIQYDNATIKCENKASCEDMLRDKLDMTYNLMH